MTAGQLRARVARIERAMRTTKRTHPGRASIHARLADLQERIAGGDQHAVGALERIHAFLDRVNGDDEP